METVINNDAVISLTCKKCSSIIKKTVKALRSNEVFNCKKCGLKYEPKNFDKSMNEVEKKIQDFSKNISKSFTIRF